MARSRAKTLPLMSHSTSRSVYTLHVMGLTWDTTVESGLVVSSYRYTTTHASQHQYNSKSSLKHKKTKTLERSRLRSLQPLRDQRACVLLARREHIRNAFATTVRARLANTARVAGKILKLFPSCNKPTCGNGRLTSNMRNYGYC